MYNRIYLDGEIPEYITSIHTPLSTSAEFSCDCEVNPQLLAKMTGIDLSRGYDLASSFAFKCSSPYQVQKRRHKKKRINKKWAKRYGYITKFAEITLQEVSLVNEHRRDDILELEFTGRRKYVVC